MANTRSIGTLSADISIEEETIPGYDAKQFYPANPGDILHGRYKLLAKLGWGSFSTVWLGKDTSRWRWQSDRYVALKLAVSNSNEYNANREVGITKLLEADPSHEGFRFVRTMIDHFEIRGPHGTHQCSVYEPMRETIAQFQQRLPDGKIPGLLLKEYMKHLLLALDYIHSTCNFVHTDIKQDNIMMGFEDPSVMEEFVLARATSPMSRKAHEDRFIYRSSYDFGPLRSFLMLPKLGDFDEARVLNRSELLRAPIQPPLFQAPEVILGTGWSHSADIWNLGVLVWNLLENRDLFRDIRSSEGHYDSRKHLGEMIALLGPPPRELLEREEKWREVKWARPITIAGGKLRWTPCEFYGGPFFDPTGKFLHSNLIPSDINLPDSVVSLEGDDKVLFLDFVDHMLQWLPENRKSAKDLLKHPWLGGSGM